MIIITCIMRAANVPTTRRRRRRLQFVLSLTGSTMKGDGGRYFSFKTRRKLRARRGSSNYAEIHQYCKIGGHNIYIYYIRISQDTYALHYIIMLYLGCYGSCAIVAKTTTSLFVINPCFRYVHTVTRVRHTCNIIYIYM